MKAEVVIRKLEEQFPLFLAMGWDNSGLQVGSTEQEIKKIYVALDATNEVIETCVQNHVDLLVTHHPLLMSGIKQVNNQSMHGRKILALASNQIVHYAMHTNYDVAKMADLAGDKLKLQHQIPLEQTGVAEDGTAYGIGCIGELEEECTAGECCELVKKAFGLSSVRLFGKKEAKVKRVALCPGSGKSMTAAALTGGAQILITGDIGHHDGLDAWDDGLQIIDAGHYGIEHIFIRQVSELLQNQFPELEILAEEHGEPFEVI